MRTLRRLLAKVMLRRARRALLLLDAAMRGAGMSRQERRRTMRGVVAGHIDPAELLRSE